MSAESMNEHSRRACAVEAYRNRRGQAKGAGKPPLVSLTRGTRSARGPETELATDTDPVAPGSPGAEPPAASWPVGR